MEKENNENNEILEEKVPIRKVGRDFMGPEVEVNEDNGDEFKSLLKADQTIPDKYKEALKRTYDKYERAGKDLTKGPETSNNGKNGARQGMQKDLKQKAQNGKRKEITGTTQEQESQRDVSRKIASKDRE